ncbi:hypothetical protein P12x_003655 [Tundrisphaera lichenicola]|uniref:hypothetical protein n=1 Tax=Tundrisphaera lichenicola TaxID=2029860 RepID=UPI003EB7A5EE
MVRRKLCLALTAFAVGTGCHAGLSGNTTRQPPALPRETVTVKKFVDQHNQNAAAIKAVSARPRIEASVDGKAAGVKGYMDFERPRGFRLALRGTGVGQVADIGSNDQEFWFWIKDNEQKAIYFCDYKDVNDSQLAITYQPDWIIESLGFREIDEREAATIAATTPVDHPELLILTQARRDNRGEMLKKETIVNKETGRIKEHRLWSANKELLAKATVTNYKLYTLNPTEDANAATQIYLPENFRLEWVAEKLVLNVTMDNATINPVFPREMRQAKFTEPKDLAQNRVNLAQLGAPAGNASRIHETMPSPRSGVRLGQPEPVQTEVEGALRPAKLDPPPLPTELSGTYTRSTGVVGAPIPRGLDPEAFQASSNRQSWRPSTLDR